MCEVLPRPSCQELQMKFTLGKIIVLVGAVAFLLILSSALRMTHSVPIHIPSETTTYVPAYVPAPPPPKAPVVTTVTVVADAPIPPPTLPQEIWAQGPSSDALVQATRKLLTASELVKCFVFFR